MSRVDKVFIGVGSNLNNPQQQVITGINKIANLPKVELIKQSSLYNTKPVGYLPQPDFVNAVIEICACYTPLKLLELLLKIEQEHGRVRSIKNGPRTLDLDILLFGDIQVNTAKLVIPHPRMQDREFVMLPLREITGEL